MFNFKNAGIVSVPPSLPFVDLVDHMNAPLRSMNASTDVFHKVTKVQLYMDAAVVLSFDVLATLVLNRQWGWMRH